MGITREGACDMQRLNQWLSRLLQDRGADLFRSKGILVVDGCDERCVRALGTAGRLSSAGKAHLATWLQ